jgi:hypothetical protein
MEMTRFKYLLAAAAVAAIIGFTPNAHAQNVVQSCLGGLSGCTVHFVGVGSSAQYLPAAIGADALALTKVTSGQCVFHWSAKNNANLVDNRGTVAIPLEPGNEWIVWIANQDGASCPTSSGSASVGNTNITDIWLGMSVDSTVGNRAFLAQNTAANGNSGVAVETIPIAAGNLLGTGSHILWPDNAVDVSVLAGGATNIPVAVGTDQAGIKDVHVNTGMTDIRAEDALYATTRSMAKLNATLTGLGYNNTTNVGQSILTSEGTGTKATPVKFALSGNDPITKLAVRPWTTFTIGAAPIVFIYNNGGDSTYPIDLVTGVLSTGTANVAGSYKTANLFDGTTACTTLNPAFDAYSNGTPATATNITLFLREPLSGTMNTTEFNVFRTTGNTSDSQEKGVNPATANPLSNLACASGGGRSRGIGTGEIVGTSSTGVLGTAHSLGYIFTGFANLAKFGGASAPGNYNYLTLDGIDPFGFAPGVYTGEAAQQFPNCAGPCAATTYWTGGITFPNLRNGSYKAWSIYRWDVPNPDPDPTWGPTALAQATEDNIDNSNAVADFVPFATSSGSDGLEVYRSHRTEAPTTCTATGPCNGTATGANSLDGGNTLGVNDEGGDVGGLIEGPFGTPYTTGHVDTTTVTCVSKKGYEIHFESGDAFVAGASWEGLAIEIGGVSYQVSTGVPVTATALYVGGNSTSKTCTGPVPPASKKGLFYNITGPASAPAAATPGVIGKKM